MPPRSPFRVVPPLALIAVLVAVWLLAQPASDDPADRPVAGTTTTSAPTTTRRTYTVRPGDNLSSVATRYGLDVQQLIELNPQVDPQALRTGQRIRLRPRD
ncbi:unannotated protein [freshwater metagenome]|uniref:Unannotated protein n=1 Tax=freshwater metagenome TaxID=449393 RepID=A0A6J7KZX0_9ZZZZ|nr:LysM peptidoglycan-binding domain-containing protein [Actinomycetota bacterium]